MQCDIVISIVFLHFNSTILHTYNALFSGNNDNLRHILFEVTKPKLQKS